MTKIETKQKLDLAHKILVAVSATSLILAVGFAGYYLTRPKKVVFIPVSREVFYYVAETGCSDEGPGTAGEPWCTIAKQQLPYKQEIQFWSKTELMMPIKLTRLIQVL